jgi:OOP family OmpA-OmpF porin
VAQKQPPRVIVKNVEPKETTDPFAGPPQPKETFVVSDILFEFDKDELRPEFMDLLKRLVAYLNKPPVFKSLLIEGHTDYIGLPEYNLDLSQRRAGRVKSTLISMGLSEAKIRSVGYGATRPVANNGNYQGRALNRRVEFKVER